MIAIANIQQERDNLSGLLQGNAERIQLLEGDIERIADCLTLPPDSDIERIAEEIDHLRERARDSQGLALAGQLADAKRDRDMAWRSRADALTKLDDCNRERDELAEKVQELQSIVACGAFAASEPNEPNCMKCVNCEKVTADRDAIYRELLSLRDEKKHRN